MPYSIREQLEHLHRKIHQLIWLNGVCWGLSILLMLALLVISFDWSVNISDPVIRLLLGLGVGGLVAWSLWRNLLVPLKTPLTDLDLALKIEQRYPDLQDSFSSSIEFDHSQESHFGGSAQLRQAVIDDAYRKAGQINFLELIDTHPIRKIMMTAALLSLVVATLTLVYPHQTGLGIQRFLLPFSAPEWPQQVELQLLDENLVPIETGADNPYQVVEGQSFQFFVENRKGMPPEDLQLEYLTNPQSASRGKSVREPLRVVSVPDPSGTNRDLGTGSLVVSGKEVKLRAIGGDDLSMNWLTIVSVPPTTLDIQEVELTPPAYSEKPIETLPAGIGDFKALVGTRVTIKAVSNKLLKSVALRIKDNAPVSIPLETDRKHFIAEFTVQDPGTYSYWFEIENDQGFKPPSPHHYEITAITDSVPEVFLEEPQTDLQVTPEAEIPLTVSIRDDLKVARALIRYQKSSREESLSRALRTDRETQTFPLPLNTQTAHEPVIIRDVWKLSQIKLTEGDRVIFRAEATDHFQQSPSDSRESQTDPARVGTSISRVLTIVTPQYKTNELANRQAHLLEELARVLKDQRLLNSEVKDVQHQLDRVGQARPEEVDTIKQVEMDQKRVASQLFSPRTGLEQRSRELMQELKWNQIKDPAMSQRLGELNTELSQLNQSVFPQIEEQITQARKQLQSKADAADSEKPNQKSPRKNAAETESKASKPATEKRTTEDNPLTALNRASQGQEQVINRLDSVLKSLSQWQKTRDLVAELDEQIQQQSDIQKQTEQLAKKTLTKSFNKLKLQEQADLEKLASRQEQQAEQFKSFRNLLESLDSQSEPTTPAEQLKNQEAQDFLKKKSIPDEMRQSAERLKQNQVGQALQEQQQIQQSLEQLKEIFENQPVDSTDQFLKKLKQSEQELGLLQQQQQEILKKLRSADASAGQQQLQQQLQQLAKQEQALQEQLKQLERQLQRLSLQKASQSLRRAGERLTKSSNALQQNQTAQAEQEIEESLDDLEQAQRELANRRQEMEESLAFEEIAKLESQIRNLIDRQDAVIQETIRLEQERLARGRWSRGQLKSLKQLLETELDLKEETEAVSQKIASAPVFVLALKQVQEQLEIAVERLDQREAGEETQAAEQTAKAKLAVLLQILEEKAAKNSAPPQQDQQLDQNAPAQASPPTDQVAMLSQLKLLKLMQEDLLNRTRSFNNSLNKGKALTPEQDRQRQRLSKEQTDLADLSTELLHQLNQSETSPADPPGLENEE